MTYEVIPWAPRYEINQFGTIRNRETGKTLTWLKSKNTKMMRISYQGKSYWVSGRRWVDSVNGKFSCWQGCIDEDMERAVVAKTVQQFEKQFILQVDAMELEPTLATAEETAETANENN